MGWPFDSLIAKVYIPMYHAKGQDAIDFFLKSSVARKAFLSVYRDLEPQPQMTDDEKIVYAVGVISQYVEE